MSVKPDKKKLTPAEVADVAQYCSENAPCPSCRFYKSADCVHELLYAAADTIKKLIEAQRWIPVTEALPEVDEDDIEVLVMIKGAKEPTTLYANDEGEFYAPDDNGGTFYLVTHWRPMPAGITPPPGGGGDPA